jgi:hypothetical protein
MRILLGRGRRNGHHGQNWSQNLDEDMGTQGRNDTGEVEAIPPGGALLEDSKMREGGMDPMPHPLSIMQEERHVQPPFFHL